MMNIIIPNSFNFLEEVKKVYDKITENESNNLSLLNSKIFLPNNRACRNLKNIFIKNVNKNFIIPAIISPLNITSNKDVILKEKFECISKIINIIDKYNSNIPFLAKYNLAQKIYNFINCLALEKLQFNNIISKFNYDNKFIIDIINESIIETQIFQQTENNFIHLTKYTREINNYKSPTIVAGFTYSHSYLMDFLKSITENVIFIQQENDNIYNLFDKYVKYLNINLNQISYKTNQTEEKYYPLSESESIYEEAKNVALLAKYYLDKGKKILLVSLDKFFNYILKKYLNEWNIFPDDSAGIQLNETKTYKIFILIIECLIDKFSLISTISLLHVIYKDNLFLLEFESFCQQKMVVPQNFRNAILEFISLNKNFSIPPIYKILIKYIEQYIKINENQKSNHYIIKLHFSLYNEIISILENPIDYLDYIEKLKENLFNFITNINDIELTDYKTIVESLSKEIYITTPYGYTPNILLLSPMEANFIQSDICIICEYNQSSWKIDNEYFILTESQKREIELNWNDRRNANISNALKMLINQNNEVYIFRSNFKMNQKQEICKILNTNNLISDEKFNQILYLLNKNLQEESLKKNQYINKNFQKTLGKNPKTNIIKSLSVSDIDKLINNPYEFYARKYLKLKSLPRLDNSNNTALIKGNIIHKTIEYIDKNYPNKTNINIENIFKNHVLNLINNLEINLELVMDLILKLDNIIDFWKKNISDCLFYKNEEKGNIFIELSNKNLINIKCIADKIQLNLNKELDIIDYKTGTTYNASDIINFAHPQLIIEGIIALRGGFNLFQNKNINDLIITQLGGTNSSLNKISIKKIYKKELLQLISEREKELKAILEKYFVNYNDFTPIKGNYYTEYDHLSRIKEAI